ncbi:hypothetical protein Pyrde_1465 [Pyrodictium delaneyi]|uniref:Uncharacterized protein n=1 Tax=Pyrodictium delaneyi TaxID=1273541 RepID=A0A0P0N5F7_9CREN|nr:hypothetical protein Pyrde_1465 [Pyrodictium delaneyi]
MIKAAPALAPGGRPRGFLRIPEAEPEKRPLALRAGSPVFMPPRGAGATM